jgi:hypothetical protein
LLALAAVECHVSAGDPARIPPALLRDMVIIAARRAGGTWLGRGTFTARPIDAYASTVSGHGHTMDMANHRLRSLLATGRTTQARRDPYVK